MTARLSVCPIIALALLATPALASETLGEICSGSEIVQSGSQPPKTLPYHVSFSADLAGRAYCYGACGKVESFPISDPSSVPIKLADLKSSGQVRYITFDPRTAAISRLPSATPGVARNRNAKGVGHL